MKATIAKKGNTDLSENMMTEKVELGATAMVQQLRVRTAFAEDLSWFPAPMSCGSQSRL